MRSYYLLLATILFVGCSSFVSWDESVDAGIGCLIVDIQKAWGKPDGVTLLPNGQQELKYHFKTLGRYCVRYWIVDKEGVVTGHRYAGFCRPTG